MQASPASVPSGRIPNAQPVEHGNPALSLTRPLPQLGNLPDIGCAALDVPLAYRVHDHCCEMRLGRHPDPRQLELILDIKVG